MISSWKRLALGDVATVEAGGNAPQGEHFFLDGTLPFVRVQHFDGQSKYVDRWDNITHEATVQYRLQKYPAGSILMPKSGASINLEKRAILARDSYVVSHLAVLHAKPQVCHNEFLYYLLRTIQFANSSGGSTLPFLNLSQISETEILLPPLREQRAMATVLSQIHTAVETRVKISAVLNELRFVTTAKFFGELAMKSRVPLEEVIEGDIQNGLYKHSSEYCQDGTSIVRITDFPNEGGVIADVPNAVRISSQEFERFLLRPGDILVNRVNSLSHLGKCALVEGVTRPTIFESNMMRFSVRKRLALPGYVFLWLRQPEVREQMRRCAKQAVAQASINQFDIRSIMVPIPNLERQRAIISTVQAIQDQVRLSKDHGQNLSRLFEATLSGLMSGMLRLRGKCRVILQ